MIETETETQPTTATWPTADQIQHEYRLAPPAVQMAALNRYHQSRDTGSPYAHGYEAIYLAESIGSLPVGYTFTVTSRDMRYIVKAACRVLVETQHELRLALNRDWTTTITKVLRTPIDEGDRKAQVGRLFSGETLTLPAREAANLYASAHYYSSLVGEDGRSPYPQPSRHTNRVCRISHRDGRVTLYVLPFPPYAETQNPNP